jgi:hypothetical protein
MAQPAESIANCLQVLALVVNVGRWDSQILGSKIRKVNHRACSLFVIEIKIKYKAFLQSRKVHPHGRLRPSSIMVAISARMLSYMS